MKISLIILTGSSRFPVPPVAGDNFQKSGLMGLLRTGDGTPDPDIAMPRGMGGLQALV
jgi:hypothetical protein